MDAISHIPPQAADSGDAPTAPPAARRMMLAQAAMIAARQVIARARQASRQPRTVQGRWYAQMQSDLLAWHNAGGFASGADESGGAGEADAQTSRCAVD